MGNSHVDQLLDKWIVFEKDTVPTDKIWEAVVEEGLGVSRKNGEDFKSLLTRFQDDKGIREKLRQIDIFSRSVGRHIDIMKRRLKRVQSNKSIADDISKIRTDFDAALYHLQKIVNDGPSFLGEMYPSMLDIEIGSEENKEWINDLSQYSGEAITATRSLKKLNELLALREQSLPISRGRPKVDQHGFVKVLAYIYRRYIGRPSSYENGPFAEVVRIALAAVGLPADDPSRAIRAALNDIH